MRFQNIDSENKTQNKKRRVLMRVRRFFVRNIKISPIPVASIAVIWLVGSILTDNICLIKSYTGIPCPACGMTRAAKYALCLDFEKSLKYHPLFFPFAAVTLFSLRSLVFKNKKFCNKYAVKIHLAGIIAVLGVYAVRMIMFFPDVAPMDFSVSGIFPRILNII